MALLHVESLVDYSIVAEWHSKLHLASSEKCGVEMNLDLAFLRFVAFDRNRCVLGTL